MAAIIISGKGGNVGSLNRAENKTRPETNEEKVMPKVTLYYI